MRYRVMSWMVQAVAPMVAVMMLAGGVGAAQPLRVVATLSVFADLVKQVGGDDVQVSYVASPRFNPHFIEPKPSDVLKVKQADLLVDAGLDLEAWRGPLLDAASNPNLFPGSHGELDLSVGIPLLEVPDRPLSRLMGDMHIYGNPHYWLHPENAKIMARAIAAKLAEMDPARAAAYQQRLSDFLGRLDQHIAQWQQAAASIHGKEAVAYHNEWPYLAEFLGIRIDHFLEPKPGIPPGPQSLGTLEAYMKAHGIRVIVQPTYVPRAAAEALAKRTGATVVILAQNLGELPRTKDYLSFVDYDVQQLVQAMGSSS